MIRWRDFAFLLIVDILRFLCVVALFTCYYGVTAQMFPSVTEVVLGTLDHIETLTVVAGKLPPASLFSPCPAYLDHWPSRAGE